MRKLIIISNLLLLTLLASAQPNSVTVAGSFQSELGCPGDWNPTCANTHMTYDGQDMVWQATFNIPAGSWEYKVAIDDSWTENYGAGAIQDGANIPLNVPVPGNVKFYYDHETHWITDNINSLIVVAGGSFQSELGCGGDWDPGCLASWLLDIDGDGIYSRSFANIPAGNYEFKIAINESWDINYPAGNVPFEVPSGVNVLVVFSFNSNNNEVSVEIQRASAPIPVMETWALIILSLMFSIFGIQKIHAISKGKNSLTLSKK